LRRGPQRSGIAGSSHHDSESDTRIGGQIESDAHRDRGQGAAEFSWVAAIRERLPRKLIDSREKRIVRLKKGSLGHAKTFAMAMPRLRRNVLERGKFYLSS